MISESALPAKDILNSKASSDAISNFCERHHIRSLAIFGSALTPRFRPDSDIDVLVTFDPDHIPGFAFAGMQTELEEILGRKVDLVTPGFLDEVILRRVRDVALPIYVRE